MKLSAYINQVDDCQKIFENDSILLLGNWSTCHTKFQEPIHGKGMIDVIANQSERARSEVQTGFV